MVFLSFSRHKILSMPLILCFTVPQNIGRDQLLGFHYKVSFLSALLPYLDSKPSSLVKIITPGFERANTCPISVYNFVTPYIIG